MNKNINEKDEKINKTDYLMIFIIIYALIYRFFANLAFIHREHEQPRIEKILQHLITNACVLSVIISLFLVNFSITFDITLVFSLPLHIIELFQMNPLYAVVRCISIMTLTLSYFCIFIYFISYYISFIIFRQENESFFDNIENIQHMLDHPYLFIFVPLTSFVSVIVMWLVVVPLFPSILYTLLIASILFHVITTIWYLFFLNPSSNLRRLI